MLAMRLKVAPEALCFFSHLFHPLGGVDFRLREPLTMCQKEEKMKNLARKSCLSLFFILSIFTTAYAENLGLYGINLNTDLYKILDNAINQGFRIKIYGSNLNPAYASKLFQLSYKYEVANDAGIDRQFGPDHILYRIISNNEEIKYAKGFTVYNFLNGQGKAVGSFIFDDNLCFINKNKFNNNIIPVKLYKENITIDMIFYNNDDNSFIPLFYAISFFKEASVKYAIDILNKRFGHYVDIKGENVSARYWFKDGVSVSNYFGLNDRFVFYNIDRIIEYNKKENGFFEKIKAMQQLSSKDSGEADLKGLHELM